MLGKLGERREENRRVLFLGQYSKRNNNNDDDDAMSLSSKHQFHMQNLTALPRFTNEVTMGWKIKVAFFPSPSGDTIYLQSERDLKHLALVTMGEFMSFTNDTA